MRHASNYRTYPTSIHASRVGCDFVTANFESPIGTSTHTSAPDAKSVFSLRATTHASHTGCDGKCPLAFCRLRNFNSRIPCGMRHRPFPDKKRRGKTSTHASVLERHDLLRICRAQHTSIYAPRTGFDGGIRPGLSIMTDFNSCTQIGCDLIASYNGSNVRNSNSRIPCGMRLRFAANY